MNGVLSNIVRYPYADPADLSRTLFWHCRAKVNGDPTRHKTFYYVTADPEHPGAYAWAFGTVGHPGPAARGCLFALAEVRYAVQQQADLIVLTEGEKDACTAGRLGVVSASHHGGANRFTEQQAAHFGGYRGTVLMVADRDDPGYACAARRADLLREQGVRVAVVRPADGVRTNAGGCGSDVVCECPRPCPPPELQWRGADLTDHLRAGYQAQGPRAGAGGGPPRRRRALGREAAAGGHIRGQRARAQRRGTAVGRELPASAQWLAETARHS